MTIGQKKEGGRLGKQETGDQVYIKRKMEGIQLKINELGKG